MSRKSKTTQRESTKAAAKKGGKKSKTEQGAAPVATETVAAADATQAPASEKKARKAKAAKPKRVSALDAAAQVLQAERTPMACKALIEAMTIQGLWSSPGGKTPEATLYSAISREITKKGAQARFKKAERGLFAFNG
jgi:hypothetical protein